MPFIGFLGPTWKIATPTRILHRRNVYYHIINEYSSVILHRNRIVYRLFIRKPVRDNIRMSNGDFDIRNLFFGEETQFFGFGADP